MIFCKVRASGFVDEGRGIDSECGSDSEGGKDGVCLDTSDDEELVVKVNRHQDKCENIMLIAAAAPASAQKRPEKEKGSFAFAVPAHAFAFYDSFGLRAKRALSARK